VAWKLGLQDWLESLPAEAAALDGSGTILAVNEPWRRFARENGFWGEHHGVGENYLAVCHSVGPENSYAGAARGLEGVLTGTAQTFELEFPYEVSDSTRWFRLTVTPLRSQKAAGALVMHFDVTSARGAGEELREAHDHLDALVSACPLPIVAIDHGGNVLMWNPAAERVFGWLEEEVLGKPLPIVPPEKQDEFQRWKASAFVGELPMGVETYRAHRNGGRIEVSLSTAPFVARGGRNMGAVAVYTDITARKRIERAVEESWEQLRHAQKLEAVGRLAGGVAHDFNNLLTAILSYCDLLHAESAEPAAAMVREIQRAASRAAALTKQLLAFGRKQILQLAIVDLNEVVREMEAMVGGLTGDLVELVLDLTPSPVHVHADRGELEQVLVNLVVNACDAMPAGGRLTIRTEIRSGQARAMAVLAVSDTGVGIDEKTKARLFEPFFTTKKSGRARGLGLATSHGIVEQLGGAIELESTPGAGTTFTVLLPLEARNRPRTDGALPDQVRHAKETLSTILVVDDEENVRDAVTRILSREGYTVLSTAGGEEALELLRERSKPVDLLLTDVVMTGLSGVELASLAQTANAGIGVLFMSGYNESEVLRHGVQTRTMRLLRKPFTMEELLHAVRENLRRPSTPS
jgi:two-component system, cell cycle sensor histidine kinase and response regulator CckA